MISYSLLLYMFFYFYFTLVTSNKDYFRIYGFVIYIYIYIMGRVLNVIMCVSRWNPYYVFIIHTHTHNNMCCMGGKQVQMNHFVQKQYYYFHSFQNNYFYSFRLEFVRPWKCIGVAHQKYILFIILVFVM